ncbi:uncharacterized protein LOC120010430 [Tripterygium wilfordii]|uniref:uncharacterized protein LOC120010430 n=1 Tax=Tripterygium wilfordii TaxID=458696 RepID=UPI0018F85EC5|nr:uncharacterized protein LOC120010430 [Tripterygium wilfordii]XP_038717157.1 uncharacterized protein LOC120010430 [Tripterygium wilfordii]
MHFGALSITVNFQEFCFFYQLEMDAGEASVDVHDHGSIIDSKKHRVQCNYCGKVVTTFSRLKCHLGGIRGDVRPCEKVREGVKESFRKKLMETKRDGIDKAVGKLCHPDLPLKRNWCHNSSSIKKNKLETTQTAGCGNGRHPEMDVMVEDGVPESSPVIGEELSKKACDGEENRDLLSVQTKKSIGRFFYEMGIELGVVNSQSFHSMLNATLGQGQANYKIPTLQELKGWVLQDEVKEMREYAKTVRDSWEISGCSILLDAWIDDKSRNLVNFVVECPKGPIFLRSSDISSIIDDVDALQSLLNEVIEEIGAENVVQIVACSTEGWMKALREEYRIRNRPIFWTVSVSHCIALILGKIGMMDSIRGILDKAKIISKFIYGHATVLKLWKNQTCDRELIKPSKIKPAMPFMTLENMVEEKRTLKHMFSSSEWISSEWASTVEGKKVADLVGTPSFWSGAGMVLKGTIPLVHLLSLIHGDNTPQMANIYETMDQVKETIKEEFQNKKSEYDPFWKVIDQIWDTYLHSPLHAAAYFLNPSLFYSEDFYTDTEVAFGILCCVVKMVKDQRSQDIVSLQLYEYKNAGGSFKEGSAIDKRTDITPFQWWSQYGRQYPELQKLAIRILSQTCDDASKYGLKRSMAEKLLISGRNVIEQQRMCDLAFVHYSLQLQNSWSDINRDIMADEIDPMDDWISDNVVEIASQNGESAWIGMDSSEVHMHAEGPSNFQPKEEAC